jgi:DNA-binding LacI/PurR family transcriptional regulator
VDGLIPASITLSAALAEQCRLASIPVLLFNCASRAADVSSVTGENLQGGRMTAEFLVAVSISGSPFWWAWRIPGAARDRERGFSG